MQIKQIVVGELFTNCYILISGNKAIVIDPGFDLEKIEREIDGKKLVYIILTHYHFDHVTFASKLREKTGAKILIHKKEKDFIEFEPDIFLKDGDTIELDDAKLKVIHTPGHTPGSICLLGENFIFTGDTLFKEGFGRTDLPGGSETDLIESLKKLKNIIKKGMKIYPGHGPQFEKDF